MSSSGNMLGRYELLDTIGRGGMGRVLLGRDTQSGQYVAVKLLPTSALEADPELLERLRREGEALRVLNHPNIVKMLDVVREGDEYGLILEYIPGGSLQDLLDKHPQLPLHMVLKIALELADALTRAHHLKIIHRDIKPANILLADDGSPRLTDFGLVRMTEKSAGNLTKSGALVGTVGYLSPESLHGRPPDPRSDIWSFGVVLYQMLSGRRPFEAESHAVLFMQILNEPVPKLEPLYDELPPRLINLVVDMLQKNPDQRIGHVRRVGAELEEIIEELGESSQRAIPAELLKLIATPRFDTPTPSHTMRPLPGMTPTAEAQPQDTPRAAISARWRLASAATLLLIVLVIVGGLIMLSGDSETSEELAATDIIQVEAVGPTEFMVLVAQPEPLAETRPGVGRFVLDNLRQVIELGAPTTRIRIVEYPAIVGSQELAQQIADANQAPMIIWGNYDEEFIELEIRLNYFDEPPLPPQFLQEAGNVRLRLTNERTQSIAAAVLASAAIWFEYDGSVFEVGRLVLTANELQLEPPEIVGVTVGAQAHRFFQLFVNDTEGAVEIMDGALRQAPGNPVLFQLRATALQRLGRLAGAEEDARTAMRLTDNGWNAPFILIALLQAFAEDFEGAIVTLDPAITLRPDDWLAISTRGTFRFLTGDYDGARADLEMSLTLQPTGNYPYLTAVIVALRQGRVDEVMQLLETSIAQFPDPTFEARIIAFFTGADGNFKASAEFGGAMFTATALASAFSNFSLQQFDDAIRDAELGIALQTELPELYLFLGVAQCALDQQAAAEKSYTEGLRLDPDFTVLYLLRAAARSSQGDFGGALQDFNAAQQTSAWDNFSEFLTDAGLEELSCANFF